jgi:hypothetical protein
MSRRKKEQLVVVPGSLHFYRCIHCLEVFTLSEKLDSSAEYPDGTGGRCLFMTDAICACLGRIQWMGQVTKDMSRYAREVERPVCNANCTRAEGPLCFCCCVCANHGSGKTVLVVVDAGGVKRPEFKDSTRAAVIARGNNCTALLNAVSDLLSKSSKLDKNYETNRKDFTRASKMLKYGRKMEILQEVYARLSRAGATFVLPCVVNEVEEIAPTPIYYPSLIVEPQEPQRDDIVRARISSGGQSGRKKAGRQTRDWFEETRREESNRLRAKEKADRKKQLGRMNELPEESAPQKAFSQLLLQATKKSAVQVSSGAQEAAIISSAGIATNDSKFETAGHESEQFVQESIGGDAIERLAVLERMLNEWFAAPA